MANSKTILLVLLASFLAGFHGRLAADAGRPQFDIARDLFIAQFDSKTDVDDLHSVAGVATMLRSPELEGVRYHAVAGAYGIQDGLYVPSPELFEMAFGDHWSDAHGERARALDTVSGLVIETLQNGGSVWVADAGQSDFTADWLERTIEAGLADVARHRVHVVQHSDWNESVTAPEKLAYVKANATYHRIPDGNAVGNGTPGFNSPDGRLWNVALADPETGELWRMARERANEYNGVDERYLNVSIAAGGMDFSDVAETCWIFGFKDIAETNEFFARFLGSR